MIYELPGRQYSLNAADMAGKILFFCMAVILQTHGAHALLLCETFFTSPSSCSDYTIIYSVDYNRVYGCSGGLTVTEFELYGGCSASAGSGGYDDPRIQERPADLVYSSNASGSQRYCYCQLKSINGIAAASSSSWVFNRTHSSAPYSASYCASNCAFNAQYFSGFRSALFTAAGF